MVSCQILTISDFYCHYVDFLTASNSENNKKMSITSVDS